MAGIKMKPLSPLYLLLARLIRESPSMQAAMRAGKRTEISARIKRAGSNRWDDLGPLHTRHEWWQSTLAGLSRESVKIVYKLAGKEYPGA